MSHGWQLSLASAKNPPGQLSTHLLLKIFLELLHEMQLKLSGPEQALQAVLQFEQP
jgi:hypothetical protein